MSLESLYKLAGQINLLQQEDLQGNISPMYFYTALCGKPVLVDNLVIDILGVMTKPTLTETGIRGSASETIVNCIDLNLTDLDDNQVFLSKNGTLFVYDYIPMNSPSSIDKAEFRLPNLNLSLLGNVYTEFSKTIEALFETVAKKDIQNDEFEKIKFQNVLTKLLVDAYYQGKGITAIEEIQ
jgi:hypothetical protein